MKAAGPATAKLFKRMFGRNIPAILLCSLILVAACSQLKVITPSDHRYLFLPGEIASFPVENYRAKMAWDDVPYIFFTKYTKSDGFTAVYATILESPAGRNLRFLCNVNIEPTSQQAHELYAGMLREPSPRLFGKEAPIDPAVYGAQEAHLYVADSGYFHLVLRSSRVVYSVLLEGTVISEPQVRKNLVPKLNYIRQNVNEIGRREAGAGQ